MLKKMIGLYREQGPLNFLMLVVDRVLNKLVYFKVLQGLTLTDLSIDRSYLDLPINYTGSFLSRDSLEKMGEVEVNDLPPSFITQALSKGDHCYALLYNNTLAAYGWYTNKATVFVPDLNLEFSPEWIYMYRGYTLPEFRGKRLHAIGMANAMKEYVEKGFKGLISYVEVVNFPSLKSCYRMGYQPIGKIFVLKIFGKYFTYSTPGCKAYGLKLTEKSPPNTAASRSER